MYYEFITKNGFDYYALIKAKDEKHALETYESEVADIGVEENQATKINKLSEEEVIKIFSENVVMEDDKTYTIEELREEQVPTIILIDEALL